MIDRELAATLVRVSELGKTNAWSNFLDLLIAHPPSDDEQRSFIHSVDAWPTIDGADLKLNTLASRDDELGGWAAALLMPSMSDDDVTAWIDKLDNGELGYNFLGYFSFAFGRRLDGRLLEYFLQKLENTDLRDEEHDEQYDEASYRAGYSSVIEGLTKTNRDYVLNWSRKKSALVRGILCKGIGDTDDDISVQKYLIQQLDRGVPEAVFSLYIGIRYKDQVWEWWSPTCTSRRVNRLIAMIRSDSEDHRWTMELLQSLTERDPSWGQRAARIADQKIIITLANQSERPGSDFVLALIVPRISGITTDDLTPEANQRLLDFYVKGKIEPYPSPGEIATERFIAEIVLPYAQSLSDDRWEREAIGRILLDAGRRHDRRYSPPW